MLEVTCNDRLGKKVRVKCNPDDTVGDLKKLIAAQTGTRYDKIVLKKWYTVFKDHIKLSDCILFKFSVLKVAIHLPIPSDLSKILNRRHIRVRHASVLNIEFEELITVYMVYAGASSKVAYTKAISKTACYYATITENSSHTAKFHKGTEM
ncbi:unnamed protein product [Chilo suppressalis]|uniref:Ubiquitin-like protein 5 n=1 Tax=Chilo suppressalis TaxID=168631 RepID=A0ABN8B818_CHISP|nr:unnamed protein product [Chilo suppressalis]